jgi:hypothetical protein
MRDVVCGCARRQQQKTHKYRKQREPHVAPFTLGAASPSRAEIGTIANPAELEQGRAIGSRSFEVPAHGD